MPNLCYIFYIDLSIMVLGSQTTTNDSCLIHIVFDWNDGPIVGSPFNFVIKLSKAFSRIFPMGGWGGPEKDWKLL